MFMGRALFCPEYASLKKVKMYRYMSILKTVIRVFIANNRYKTLAEMQDHAKRREIELEIHKKEKRQTSAPSHSTAKKFKPIGSRF